MTRCSIIIRAYNEEEHVGKLLEGIAAQSVSDREIILVDSGSTDATVAIASHYPVRVVKIDPDEFTFGRSLNEGCRQAAGEYLIFASAHVYPVYPDWIEQLIEPFADPAVALVHGRQRGDESTKFSERRLFSKMYPVDSVHCQDHALCNNANAAIRQGLWEAHPYDESLTGLEDLAWATWASSEGHCISYNAKAEVVHVHAENSHQVYSRYKREAIALKRIHPEERFGRVDFLRLASANIVRDSIAALRERIFSRVIGSILRFRTLQFWGTYRGFALSGPVTTSMKEAFFYPSSPVPSQGDDRGEIEAIAYQELAVGQDDGVG